MFDGVKYVIVSIALFQLNSKECRWNGFETDWTAINIIGWKLFETILHWANISQLFAERKLSISNHFIDTLYHSFQKHKFRMHPQSWCALVRDCWAKKFFCRILHRSEIVIGILQLVKCDKSFCVCVCRLLCCWLNYQLCATIWLMRQIRMSMDECVYQHMMQHFNLTRRVYCA